MLGMSPQPAAVSGKRSRTVSLLVCGLACWLAMPQLAHAQTSRFALTDAQPSASPEIEARRTTMARALFEEGLRNVDAGQWARAQDRFERVLELRYSPVAAYNLGLAQARLGHGVVAAATLRKLLVDATLDAKVRERATALLNEVEARFGWLTLRVLGRCDGCSVYLNREEWPWAAVGVSVPVDPGHYALELRWADIVLAKDRLEMAAGARLEASLAARPGALQAAREAHPSALEQPPAQAPTGLQSSASTPPGHTTLLASPWFWGAMGVLVVGAVAAIALERHSP
jgi:tetratricopeptide (TPR) repeat protein